MTTSTAMKNDNEHPEAKAKDGIPSPSSAVSGASPCSLCGGKGHYMYDHNHGKPCERCCKHDQGWWELTENFSGYIAGADNGCCRAGCGQLRRELTQNRGSEAAEG